MSEELKACPFCGWGTIVDMGGLFSHAAGCNACGAGTKNYKTWDEAKERWNRRAQPDNPPLSLDELRQMDGEPVWVEIPSDNPQWGIVFAKSDVVKLFPIGALLFRYYGEWKAYARKPEPPRNARELKDGEADA